MGVADEAERDQSAVARLLGELTALNRELEVPGPGAWGIDAARWEALVPTMCAQAAASGSPANRRSEEHPSERQSLMSISYAVCCLATKPRTITRHTTHAIAG